MDGPDRIVAPRVCDARRVSIFGDVAVDIFHEQIGRQYAGHEIPADVPVIEVVLE